MTRPAIIFVRPQLGENIGKAARAMLNFGLTDMRLVSPRDGWPNPSAGPAAAGADDVLDQAQVFDSVEAATADLNRVYAATVRPRDMVKDVVTPEQAANEMFTNASAGVTSGILFGPERSGLSNDDIVLADTILTAKVNPEFGSLNLAQAVIIAAYEWYKIEAKDVAPITQVDDEPPAKKGEMMGLVTHIEDELDSRGYFRTEDRKPAMTLTLRNMFQHARFTSQQIQSLRGVVKGLTRSKKSDT